MALPAGVTTCNVTMGQAMSYLGAGATINATLTADRTIIHQASGTPLYSGGDSLESDPNTGILSFDAPHVDQTGFIDTAGNAVTYWAYTLTGTIQFGTRSTGTKITFTKNFQVTTGQTSVDLDLVPDGQITPGVTAPQAAVTSVNGKTGAVVLAASDISDVATLSTAQTISGAKGFTGDVGFYGTAPVAQPNAVSAAAALNALGLGTGITDASGAVTSVNGKTGAVTLTAADVSAVPTTRTVNAKALSADITLTAADVSAVPTTRTVNAKVLSANITLTAADVSAVPTTRTVNAKALSADITLTAADVSAVPTTRMVAGHVLSADVVLAKADVGLGNVDNTSDVNKPVSTAQQAALNGKASRTQGGNEGVNTPAAATGTVTLDCSVASVFTITPTGAITLAPSNVPTSGNSCTLTVIINQGATAQTLTMPAGTVWLGSAPTQAASKKCVVTMLTTDGGTSWIASGAVQA